ncbi:c-type cytochrome [Roseomonas sp. BN140053]|uniref:c-type cytochrome n=1 Tax=Roseomonas sp. BN140053 TaxID=3391898 RepID=UPI0039EC5E07
MRQAGALLLLGLLGAAPAARAQDPAGDPRAGRRLAGGTCAACHGNDGIAVQPDAPSLAGQNRSYLAAQLRAYRDGTRRHEQMSVVAETLDEAQIRDLAAWYNSIEVEATVPGR